VPLVLRGAETACPGLRPGTDWHCPSEDRCAPDVSCCGVPRCRDPNRRPHPL